MKINNKGKMPEGKMSDCNNIVCVVSTNSVCGSIFRFLTKVLGENENCIELIELDEKEKNLDLSVISEKLLNKNGEESLRMRPPYDKKVSFIIVDVWGNRGNNEGLLGVGLVKRLRYAWPVHYTKDKKASGGRYLCPILLITESEVLKAQSIFPKIKKISDRDCFWNFMDVLRGTVVLNLPFSAEELKKALKFIIENEWEMTVERIDAMSAYLGYEEHHGHR